MDSKNRSVLIFIILALVVLCCCLVTMVGLGIGLFTTQARRVEWGAGLPSGRQTERIEHTFDGTASYLEVDNFAGEVTVRAGDGDIMRLVATKQAPRTSDLRLIEVDWVMGDDALRIRTSRPRSSLSNVAVDLQITVPAGTRLDLDTGAGTVRIENVVGEIKAHTGAGDVEVRGGSGPIDLDTGAGGVEYEGVPQGNCSFNTGAGGIVLRLPADANVEVELDTGVGSVDVTGFDVDGHVSTTRVDGVIGDGSQGRVEAQTGAGGIELRQR